MESASDTHFSHAEGSASTTVWHALSTAEVSARLAVDPLLGLSEVISRQRLRQVGPNRLREAHKESVWETFLEEVREPMILLLIGTGFLYALWGGWEDALTIFVVIMIVVGVEIFNEYRAENALSTLRTLTEPTVLVRRDGQYREVLGESLVPGDVLVLKNGQRVQADARLIEAYGLWADESTLTGESTPVEKEADVTLAADTPLAERRNVIFAGTAITRGRGAAIVVATGMATELGRVAALTAALEEPRTPLQRTMRELTRWMVWLALGVSVVVPLLGWVLTHSDPRQMLLTGLSLAFATIPEELPILITIVLALGAYRLSTQHAIVKHLRAAETLSAVTVIATDKTGTLTENHMVVSQLVPAQAEQKLLEIGVLCNDAPPDAQTLTGDPLDIALLQAAQRVGLDVPALRAAHPLRAEFTFDSTRKMLSVVYERDGAFWVGAKGAPEAILARSAYQWLSESERPLDEIQRRAITAAAAQMTSAGLRVIALAEKRDSVEPLSPEQAESDLTFVGLVGVTDPPRPEARPAIAACQQAGIRLIMVTGDHPLTARTIAAQVGMGDTDRVVTGAELDRLSDEALQDLTAQVNIYARTTPENKLRIVRALRARGERVAVTGDGINDAPALTAADIGIAMGETGTDVAREAADIVLADDNFATIERAIQEGRLLFANLRKAVRYYLACKVALVLATLLPVLLLVPIPFLPVQIILMELFMDVAASATFVSEKPEHDLMRQPPRRPSEPFMNRAMVTSIFASAAGLFAAVSVAYLVTWYSGAGDARARTVAFVTWLLGHVLLALNLRSERVPLLRLGWLSNRLMGYWIVATLAFVLFVTLVPAVQHQLGTVSLTLGQWALAAGTAAVGTFWLEVRKWLSLARSAARARRTALSEPAR